METTSNIKLVLATVFDSKVKQFHPPMTARTIDEHIRSFSAAATQEGHDFKKFAGDFSLWTIGYYYPETGTLEKDSPRQIANATDFKN